MQKDLRIAIKQICKDYGENQVPIADIIDELYDQDMTSFWTVSYHTENGYSHISIESEDSDKNLILDHYLGSKSYVNSEPSKEEIDNVAKIVTRIQMDLGQSKILDKINNFLSDYQDDLYIGKNPHVFITDEGEYIVYYRQAQQGENPGEIIYRTFFADSTKEIIDNILDFIKEAKVTINGKINRLEFMEHCDVPEKEAMS